MRGPPALAGVRHAYFDAAGLRMHVALAGPEDAPAVMLVHGWPQNWWAWRRVIPLLSERFRVIAPDLRGHGWSDAPSGSYEKEQLASDMLALLDTLAIERVTWVGHDWGGWTGFLAALRSPQRLESLIALAIPHPWTPPKPQQLALLAYQGPVSLPYLGRRLANAMVRIVLQAGRGPEKLTPTEVGIFADHIPPDVTVAMYRTFLTRELLPAARGRYAHDALAVPTTLLVGDRDLVTAGTATGHLDAQPLLHVEALDGVGHWIPEQRAHAVADRVLGD